jgi:hypothetical protein
MSGFDRPFRHLCPEAEPRDALTEGQFWENIARSVQLAPDYDLNDVGQDCETDEIDTQLASTPCPVCGSYGACSYDLDGRALIHVHDGGDD